MGWLWEAGKESPGTKQDFQQGGKRKIENNSATMHNIFHRNSTKQWEGVEGAGTCSKKYGGGGG